MSRRVHLAAAFAVGLALTCAGAYVAGQLVADDGLALGIGLLVGIVIGMCVVVYWEEVIDR